MRSTGVLAVIALLAVGCRAETGSPSGVAPDAGVGAGDEYVAMGDSYTAAPGIGPAGELAGCRQSRNNYPHLLAAELGLELTDVSCGGASTAAIVGSHLVDDDARRRPPQIAALSDATDLVTISVGANDGRLFGSMVRSCVRPGRDDPSGSPCAQADARAGDLRLEAQIDRMQRSLEAALDRIAVAAPEARVVVVGYPRFAPEERCEQFPVGEGDIAFVQRFNRLLVRAQERAAARSGVEFVDVDAATVGHDFCAEDPWLAGAHPTAPALAYHPYAREQRLVADLLADLLRHG